MKPREIIEVWLIWIGIIAVAVLMALAFNSEYHLVRAILLFPFVWVGVCFVEDLFKKRRGYQMKTPWHWADEIFGKEKPEIRDIVEQIQVEAYNQALDDVRKLRKEEQG